MTETRLAVVKRLDGNTRDIKVPNFMIRMFDVVMDLSTLEAFEKYPRSDNVDTEERRYWQRLDFYKKRIVDVVLRRIHADETDGILAGRVVNVGHAAMMFHQYITACKRNPAGAFDEVDMRAVMA